MQYRAMPFHADDIINESFPVLGKLSGEIHQQPEKIAESRQSLHLFTQPVKRPDRIRP